MRILHQNALIMNWLTKKVKSFRNERTKNAVNLQRTYELTIHLTLCLLLLRLGIVGVNSTLLLLLHQLSLPCHCDEGEQDGDDVFLFIFISVCPHYCFYCNT